MMERSDLQDGKANPARISWAELVDFDRLVSERPREALFALISSEQKYRTDSNFWFHYGGFFIDIGKGLGVQAIIERGIDVLNQFVDNPRQHSRATLFYNLGNGYFSLESLARGQEGYAFDPDATPLIDAKKCYRRALDEEGQLEVATRAMLRVNYGNCLSALRRSAEAINQYDIALASVPGHAMAWGNLGVELSHYAGIASDPSLLRNAQEALDRALATKEIEEIGGLDARPMFEAALGRVKGQLQSMESVSIHEHHPMQASTTRHHQAYINFCQEHHLFLNFCLRNRPCAHSTEDNVSFGLLLDKDDEATGVRLHRVINEVKERYAVARLLAFEACQPRYKTDAYDELTNYAYNLDYSVNGLRVGKLKLAFEATYNILDKIAFFINDYLELGIKESGVDFIKIWRERPNRPVRPSILRYKNTSLMGLYDVSRDLSTGGYSSVLSQIRNFSTHRYLVPHIEPISWREDVDGPDYHIGYRALLNKTIDLIQLVRNAIIYLIAFIDREERRKRHEATGIVLPIFLPSSMLHPFSPEEASV